jgi:hypothetical protein
MVSAVTVMPPLVEIAYVMSAVSCAYCGQSLPGCQLRFRVDIVPHGRTRGAMDCLLTYFNIKNLFGWTDGAYALHLLYLDRMRAGLGLLLQEFAASAVAQARRNDDDCE